MRVCGYLDVLVYVISCHVFSYVGQILMGQSEADGVERMRLYFDTIGQRFAWIVRRSSQPRHRNSQQAGEETSDSDSDGIDIVRSSATEESEDILLSVLLSEAQGGIRLVPRLSDIELAVSEIQTLDSRQRFRLGVGLAKLGLFDLSLRHVSVSATPWEAPLYRLRAKLIFSPVHRSVRSLAQTVDLFERQAEELLLHRSPKSPLMIPICNSPNEAALALQALPLLHLAGYSSPREDLLLGHSPVALPVLLSEVFTSMCPPSTVPLRIQEAEEEALGLRSPRPRQHSRLRLGVVAGSLDGTVGRLVVGARDCHCDCDSDCDGIVCYDGNAAATSALGLMESLTADDRRDVELIALCFPTPRDPITDRAMAVFDSNVNLSPHNK